MSLKHQKEFNLKVDTLLCDFKAHKEENKRNGYILSTVAGALEIALHEPQQSNVFSVYCKFKDLSKAKPVMEVYENFNPTTGKFNFHSMDSVLLLQSLENDLSNILLT